MPRPSHSSWFYHSRSGVLLLLNLGVELYEDDVMPKNTHTYCGLLVSCMKYVRYLRDKYFARTCGYSGTHSCKERNKSQQITF
jgi:hypothetical protein